MNANEIQKHLAEQRKKSRIFKATAHEIAMQINNSLKGAEVHDKKRQTMLKKYQDPDFADRHATQQQLIAQTDEWKQAHAEGMQKREVNGWYEKRGRAYKPIRTPHGDFPSKKAAIEAMTALGISNAGGKLSVWLNTKKDEYYYIDK